MAGQDSFSVRFWGVRGSIPCPGPETARYGGNTSCLEIRCGDSLLIFDSGTGIRELGAALDSEAKAKGQPLDVDLFFTHTHLDHVCGLPFFSSLYVGENRFRLAAGHLVSKYRLREVLNDMMMPPLFPVPLDIFSADMTYSDFVAGESLNPLPGVTISTAPLNHPNEATGYRIEYGGRSICYVTDTEHVPGQPDKDILALIDGADVFIYDATYTDDEFPSHVGWGHSTWQEGVRLADAAGVKTYVPFHHDPAHDDDFMDRVAAEAEAARAGTIVAKEGLVLSP
ncbi:MAG: MBL fold metallo-hydrolase [Alphaproteobacteria bacterium]|nr:MBL fold metallo-hydrolase [Alphaproteobacteria bacterium]